MSSKNVAKLLNLLTEIHLNHYSGKMISDFNQLSEKIGQLAEMAHALRRENAALRVSAVTLTAENADLQQRIEEAHQRVMALLERIPVPDADDEEEAA
jgi:cell division protein ZapB